MEDHRRCRMHIPLARGQPLQVFPAAAGADDALGLGGCLDLDALEIEFPPAVAAGKGMGRRIAPVMTDDVGIAGLGRTQEVSFRQDLCFSSRTPLGAKETVRNKS